mmetsp:Transcript_2147/g.2970  ORF Transcript_2147/g.2970 Transcript_2147/m.2970 type:complete len:439 (-) Transcript_2147:193-1509(-)
MITKRLVNPCLISTRPVVPKKPIKSGPSVSKPQRQRHQGVMTAAVVAAPPEVAVTVAVGGFHRRNNLNGLPAATSTSMITTVGVILAALYCCCIGQSWALVVGGGSGTSSISKKGGQRKVLGFLSFDLDDTFFPTSQVVDDANHVMIETMQQEFGYQAATIQDFLKTTRQVRKALTAPLTYSDLRKLAIEQEMKRLDAGDGDGDLKSTGEGGTKTNSNSRAAGDMSMVVEKCFDAWLQARHLAAERYLFEDATTMLAAIRQEHPDICIGAITNGRGDPLAMKTSLSPYFDFCVSGEDDAVFPERKPHAGIYNKALERYRALKPHHHQNNDDHDVDFDVDEWLWKKDHDYAWCHVGDCLANDVGASASRGAFAVWYAPNDHDNDDQQQPQEQPSWSTATQQDSETRAALVQQAKDQNHVGAKISNLAELPNALRQLLLS